MTSDRALVGEIAGRYLPDDVAARWLRLLRPAAALRHAGPGAQVAAVLGGEPGLPDWAQWPAWQGHGPLSFIAAIDCAALAAVPLDITLPGAGTLLFFYFDGQCDNGETTVGFWDPSTLAGAQVRSHRARFDKPRIAGSKLTSKHGANMEQTWRQNGHKKNDLGR